MKLGCFNEERCVSCGEIIPEGRQVCASCETNDLKTKHSKSKPTASPQKTYTAKPTFFNTPSQFFLFLIFLGALLTLTFFLR